ncbi:hypothetical protein A3K82_03690 [Candidatus Pacearchaeota archaeon RBG_19FT_COMBO_34_9]|nr:MAG: hypothetical protein A3K82_03690 [Candidatus Pacearchaeota archaeon RBG_19FT_COMBO_34_9]OGJ16141.1 MAG: hypothetical protein A3K74_02830 [Candidatus Pacearchaeota archaeon RBG_13_33_26]
MKRGRKKEKKEIKKEEISEIFKIENGRAGETASLSGKQPKERIIKTHKIIEEKEKAPSREQIKKESKIFRNIIILMIGFVLLFFIVYASIYFTDHFKVGGVKFEVIKIGELILYKTSVSGIINESGAFVMGKYDYGQKADYNFYFRKDPRKLQNIPLGERIPQIRKENVIDIKQDFNCGGDGVIAIANLLKLYEVAGANIIKDENASCDSLGRYGWISILEGNETKIERFGPACLELYVSNCEILDVTEKFMLETLMEIHKRLGI